MNRIPAASSEENSPSIVIYWLLRWRGIYSSIFNKRPESSGKILQGGCKALAFHLGTLPVNNDLGQ
jgi:hypothetical protein